MAKPEGDLLGVVIVNETLARRYWPGVDPFARNQSFRSPYYAAISVLCIAVAFLAVLLPARGATANPMDALRSE